MHVIAGGNKMADFFRKKKNEETEPEDFVLLTPEEETPGDSEEVIENTNSIDISQVNEALAKKDKPKFKFVLNRRFAIKLTAGVLAVLIVALGVFGVIGLTNSLYGYEQVAAAKNNIMRSFDVESVLLSGNSYEITSLVAGKIISADVEVGDEVRAGEVLYKLDDTEAKLIVERAKNELDRAKDPTASSTVTSPRIIATDAGVIESLKITSGSTVNAGSHIGTLKKSDDTIVPIVSYVSGKVNVVSVRAGQSLSVGQLIATVKDNNSGNAENSAYSEKSSEIDLQTAQRQLENYTIKSPVTGVVVEKNSKAGDNVGITNSDKPMMIIVDTSELSFKFSVDEYRVREVERGQDVIVTTESIPDTSFDGVISAVSNQGYKNDEGKTVFDVTVTISKPEDLKAGMNIKANVILASRKNVLSVPQKALMATDGKNALVLVKKDADDIDEDAENETLENQLAFPWIKVPKNCDLITVTYGLSDGTTVQIFSGLKAGDIVVYKESKDYEFVQSSAEVDDEEEDFFDSDFMIEDNNEIQQDLEKEIEDMLQQSNNL